MGRLFQELGMKVAHRAVKPSSRIPVLVYGAGRRGRILAEACGVIPELSAYRVVAFFDDNGMLTGKRLDGLPIFTPQSRLKLPDVHEIWISSPTISPFSLKRRLPTLPIKKLKLELK
jgi:FlaA1/EpsC-like NDP-sugar epimerase